MALLFSFSWAGDFCASSNWVAKDFKSIQMNIDKKIANSANLVPIAKEADGVLSKLITAKSPILFNWLEKRQLMNKKEETIAKEWRKYYLENFILSQYPTKNIKINSSVEKLFADVNRVSFSSQFKQKAEKLFQQAKKDSLSVIHSWKLDKKTTDEIKNRIIAIELYWFNKLQDSKYEKIALEFIKWGVAYDPANQQINMGVQSLKYASDTTLYSVFVHEIGHSFDSCRWGAFLKTKNPFEKLYACLRNPKATGAKPRDDSKMATMLNQNALTNQLMESLQKNTTCNRSFYPPAGIQKEQILEVFADWFAAEVVATSQYINKNLRADLCEEKSLNPGSSYLSNKERLEKIYFAQPKIAKTLKQTSTAKYCKVPAN